MTRDGLLAPHPYDSPGLAAAKQAVAADPPTKQAWEGLREGFFFGGYGQAAIWSWRESARYPGSADAWFQQRIAELEAGGRLFIKECDAKIFRHLQPILRQFGGSLPLFWCNHFVFKQFTGFLTGIQVETSDRVFDPHIDFLMCGGLVSCGAQILPRDPITANQQDTVLGHLMAADPDATIEAAKARVRAFPMQFDRWKNLIQALQRAGREPLATLCEDYARAAFPTVYARDTQRVDKIRSTVAMAPSQVFPDHARLRTIADRYFSQLRKLSDPPAQLRFNGGDLDFPCNEPSYPKAFLPGAGNSVGLGGAYLGTGAGLFLAHMVHQRAVVGYVVDYNRMVTEMLIPAIGLLLAAAESPVDWLSWLLGVPLSPQERADLMRQPMAEIVRFFMYRESDDTQFATVMAALCELLRPYFPHAEWQRAAAHFVQFAYDHWFWKTGTDVWFRMTCLRLLAQPGPKGHGGLLANRATFAAAQRLWREGRVIGVSGDWRGRAMARIGDDLRRRGLPLRVIYPSNLLEHSLEYSHMRHSWRRLQANLQSLPTDAATIVLQMERGGVNLWRYRYDNYLRMIAFDPSAKESRTAIHCSMRALAAAAGNPQKFVEELSIITYEKHRLWRTLKLLAGGCSPSLTETNVMAEAQRAHLSPNDTWRLLFLLREAGCMVG